MILDQIYSKKSATYFWQRIFLAHTMKNEIFTLIYIKFF